jgi:hypothetical protein
VAVGVVGKGLTVTTTWSVLLQVPKVAVTVKVVVDPAVKLGLAMLLELNPVDGDHEKVLPAGAVGAPPILTVEPKHII